MTLTLDPEVLERGGVRLEENGLVATITLDRPATKNAQTPSTWMALRAIGASLDPSAVPAALPIDPRLPYKDAQERVLQHFDAVYLAEVLERCDGNLTHAAKAAQLARHNFRRRLRKAGVRHSG